MGRTSSKIFGNIGLCIVVSFLYILAILSCAIADVNYELDYQDPAGDVLEFNETWSNLGLVDSQPQIDLKWLRSSNDTMGNVVLRMEIRKHQVIEQTNETKYVFRIFISQDNSTGYNITYINGSANITSFNNTLQEDMTSNISIIDDQGEILTVKVSKSKYLANITHFNLDAYTWKEQGNRTYIDYISEVPGHPGATGTVLDQENGDSDDDEGLLGLLCSIPIILILIIIVIIIVVIIILAKR